MPTAHWLRKVPGRKEPCHRDLLDLDAVPAAERTCARPGKIGPILLRRQENMKKTARIELPFAARARSIGHVLTTMPLADRSGNVGLDDELVTLVPAQSAEMRTLQNAQPPRVKSVAGYQARRGYAFDHREPRRRTLSCRTPGNGPRPRG